MKKKRNRFEFEECPNCTHPLNKDDKYCPNCGQKNKDYRTSIHYIFWDFFGSFLNFDNRILRTLWQLLFRPGKVPSEYADGKRARFVPPFRLYLFLSFVFFLLLQSKVEDMASGMNTRSSVRPRVNPGMTTKIDLNFSPEPSQLDSVLNNELTKKINAFKNPIDDDLNEFNRLTFLKSMLQKGLIDSISMDSDERTETEIDSTLENSQEGSELKNQSKRKFKYTFHIQEDLDTFFLNELKVTNGFLHQSMNDQKMNDSLKSLVKKKYEGNYIQKRLLLSLIRFYQNENFQEPSAKIQFYKEIARRSIKFFSYFLLVFVPLAALIPWVLNLRIRKFIWEHLVFSIYQHSAVLMVFLVSMVYAILHEYFGWANWGYWILIFLQALLLVHFVVAYVRFLPQKKQYLIPKLLLSSIVYFGLLLILFAFNIVSVFII